MLTEAQAWRRIARKIVAGKWAKEGLCFEAYRLCDGEDGGIPWATYYRMTDRIDQSLPSGGYAYPKGTEPEGRVLAALWMALEVEDECKQRRKVKNKK